MSAYKFNPLLKGIQEAERALAAQSMIANGVIKERAFAMTGANALTTAYIAKLGVASAAELTFAQRLKLSTMMMWENVKAWAATPWGMATTAVVGIGIITMALKAIIPTFEKMHQAHEQSKADYEDITSALQSMQSELETTKQRIEELEGLEIRTSVEESELENLRTKNNLLNEQIEIQKRLQEYAERDVAKTAADALTEKDTHVVGTTIVDGQEVLQFERTDIIDRTIAKQNELKDLEAERAKLIREMSEKGENIDEKSLERYNEQIANLDKAMASVDSELASNLSNITNLYSGLFDADGNIVSGYEALVARVQALIPALLGVDEVLQEKKQTIKDIFYDNMSGKNLSGDLLGGYVNEFNNWVESLSEDELGVVYELTLDTDSATWSLSEWQAALETKMAQPSTALKVTEEQIKVINTGIDDVQARISSLADSLTKLQDGSMTVSEVVDLIQQFPELAEYVDLTADGFGNLEEGLRDLLRKSPDKLIDDLMSLKETTDLTEAQRDAIDGMCSALESMPTDAVRDVSGEYGVLADSINAAIEAQTELEKKLSEPDWDSGYNERVKSFEGFEEVLESGEYGSKAYSAYKDYFIRDDLDYDSSEIKTWMENNKKYFAEGADGILAFLDTVEQLSDADAAFAEIASYDSETKAFYYDINRLSEFAEKLGWTEEMLQDFIYKYRMYVEDWTSRSPEETLSEFSNNGLTFEVGDETFASLDKLTEYTRLSEDEVKNLVNTLNEFRAQQGMEPIQLIGSDQILITQEMVDNLMSTYNNVDMVRKKLAELAQGDYTVEVGATLNGLSVADVIAEDLLSSENPESDVVSVDMKINVNGEEVVQTITATSEKVKLILGEGWEAKLDSEDAETRLAAIEALCTGLSEEDTIVTVKDKTGEARSNLEELAEWLDKISKNKRQTITVDYSTNQTKTPSGVGGGGSKHDEVIFDANATGAKKAKAGPALLGDEYSADGSPKPELVVSDGKAYIAGSGGPEIRNLKDGDVVYTADETEEILSGNRNIGSFPAHAGGVGNGLGDIETGSSYQTNKHDADDELEVFDWIEIAIERIGRAVDKLTNIASSAYKSLKTRLGAAADAIIKVNEQIAVQQAAYERYMKEADSVGLSADLKKRVQNGAIDLTEYDEDTQKLISDYQEWYQKAQDVSDGIDDLHESLAGLYEEQFNAIQEDYENQLDLLDHMTDSFDAAIEEQETRGYLVSTKLYAELQKVEQERIALLQKQLEDLEKSYSDAVNSDEFEGGAGALHDMQMAINDVKSEIQDATIALQEYNNELRNLEWERFDYQQERISALTDEANFLIDLLSSEKMYDENGKLTDAGQATIGLHGQNYNVYMAQADDYAKEIEDINRDLANDPNNTLLLERKEELLELQRESILAAEDEKQAMIALAEEGIQAEIDAMQKLIDARKDALDSAKDLHDYQNKIEDHNEEIGDIRKQIAAYKGDDSEETRAKLQKLQNDLDEAEKALEETEYDRYIEDQKRLLDSLMLEYESLLNQKLDNTDALIESMIASVNTNSASISETITAAGNDVGYDLSEQMKAIWGSEGLGGVISVYGDEFDKELTAVNETLDDIKKYIESMVEESDEDAEEAIPDANPVVTPSTEPDKPNTDSDDDDGPIFQKKEPSKINPPGKPIENEASEITVGNKINAGSAKIYDYAGDTTGNNQYFSDDPVYTVLSEDGEYIEVRHHSLTNGTSGWFKKSDVKAYKTGGLVDYTGLAWVDGQKGKPEAFLNAEDTENIKAFVELLNKVRSGQINLGGSIVNNSAWRQKEISDLVSSSVAPIINEFAERSMENSIGEINIAIDHVQDYDDFVRQLRDDPKFERIVQAMTTDRLAKKGSLRKYTYNR